MTIDSKLCTEKGRRELLKKIKKLIPYTAPDLSDQKVCDEFCIRYGKAIRPGIEEVDRSLRRSKGGMFTKVVRGGYHHN